MAVFSLAVACNDSGDPTSTGTDGSDSETGDGDGDPTTGDGDGDPTTGDGDGDGDPTTGDGDGDPTTGDGDGDPTTGDGDGECSEQPSLGDWLFQLGGDAVFPNDVPTDVDETCTVLDGDVDRIALDCEFADFELVFLLEPLPALPASGATAQVRLHHEGGWNNWPDLWISVDVLDGDLYSFQTSSVLLPKLGAYTVPWAPSLTDVECGPFVVSDPIGGEDSCGEQVGKQVAFEVDGEQVTAWHASYSATTIADAEFEVWLSAAREYLSPPETCDFSPSWYSIVTRRQG